MATYYRWRKSTISYSETSDAITTTTPIPISNTQTFYIKWAKPGFVKKGYDLSDAERLTVNGASVSQTFMHAYVAGSTNPTEIYTTGDSTTVVNLYNNTACILPKNSGGTIHVTKYTAKVTAGSFVEYVYSTSPSAYPNGGISGDYYYDSRTTITSPTAPSSISYPATITASSVTVSWTAASSLVPSYSVNYYELTYSKNGEPWVTQGGNGPGTSRQFVIPTGTTSIQFRVRARARDSNNQWGAYTTGTVSQVVQAPTLTVPEMVMQGQSAAVSWSGVEGAYSYTLERKSSADEDWTQVYSGDSLSFTETVGTWTSLQYRVCAVFGESATGWAASGEIQIVAASALVISGSDGDLGTLTSDVSYSVSSDQTSPVIEVTVAVNGGEYAAFQAVSGQNYRIGVLDLPTGTGSIVITASMEVSNSPVTVTRTWAYTKTAQSFPAAGSVARLTQEGDTIWPQTLAEAVRTIGGPWGGDLSKALNLLQGAAVYNRTSVPKYTEVKVDLSQITTQDAKDGKIIMLPYQGRMVSHIVVQVGNPDPEMYDASCDGVWLLRKDIGENGQWNSSGVNTLAGSTIMTTMQGYVADYDSTVQAAIKTVKIPYCVGGGDTTVKTLADGLECKIFPLSGYEVGWTTDINQYFPVDGSTLSYFQDTFVSDAKRVSSFNGSASVWHLRSQNTGNSGSVWSCNSSGGYSSVVSSGNYGLRLSFLLPTTFQATYYVDTNGGIHEEQEYAQGGSFADLWGNDIPTAKIETGSYTGTGTYGASNPNTLTFSFVPKIVFISFTGVASETYSGLSIPFISSCRSAIVFDNRDGSSTRIDVSWSGQNGTPENSVSWYGNSPATQLNTNGITYQYIALG